MRISDKCATCLYDKQKHLYFGKKVSYKETKKKYNDLVLGMEKSIRKKIEEAEKPSEAALAGTPYGMLPEKARKVVNTADVILAKGQGNYESLSEENLHIFFSFLCKCEHFMQKFDVPKLTGMFIEKR